MPRFKKHLFLCTNQRSADDPKGCCALRGSADLLDYAKTRVHEMGLKGQVRINKAGCLDACKFGPTLVVYPDDVWYQPRTKEDMEEILQHHIQNGQVVERLTIQFKKT
jgi:(2Fe-2S) ferredoxin